MARIVPSDIARLELAGANCHEIETLRRLQARLPDSYTVFHGVHWTREWPGETVFGELDFVVVNRAGKALLIEQKDGTLEETDDGLIAHYADRSKSVVDQVQRALDNVRDKFRRNTEAWGLSLVEPLSRKPIRGRHHDLVRMCSLTPCFYSGHWLGSSKLS